MGFAEFYLLFEVVPLIGVGLAFADADFDFHAAVLPIHAQQRKGAAFDGYELIELEEKFLLIGYKNCITRIMEKKVIHTFLQVGRIAMGIY